MSQNIVSKENIVSILKPIKENIADSINNLDVPEDQRIILDKANILEQTDEIDKVLCNDGTYKEVSISHIDEVEEKTNEVTELFDVAVNKQEEKWETKLSMPTTRYYLTSSIYEDKIYCIGGNGDNTRNECYNVSTNTWENKLSMPTGRSYLTSSIYEDKIYVVGGYDRGEKNNNECYNISTDTWETKKDMPTSRCRLVSSIYEDKIYCIGGNGGLNKNECYNASTDTWETKLNMPTSRWYLTSSIYKDKIYCIGGYDAFYSNINECYNVSTNTWETKRYMTTARYGLTSCIYKDKIYCIGGKNSSGNLSINECYNVYTDTWETKLNIPTDRFGLTSSIYKDKIYCISGDVGNKNECYYIENSISSYNISLPDNLGDKLESINTEGDGTKVLSDNGQYIDIPKGYRFLTDEEVRAVLNEILV